MGIMSWFKGDNKNSNNSKPTPVQKSEPKTQLASKVPCINGVVEVRRPNPPADITIFYFGSVAGFCQFPSPCSASFRRRVLPVSVTGVRRRVVAVTSGEEMIQRRMDKLEAWRLELKIEEESKF